MKRGSDKDAFAEVSAIDIQGRVEDVRHSKSLGRNDPSGENASGKRTIKIVIVGDTAVGKTCLVRNYLYNDFSEDYMPNVLDIWEATRTVRGKQIELELVDTSGDPYLQVDRQIKYSKADGFMLCAAVNAMSSFENVEKWVQEISVI